MIYHHWWFTSLLVESHTVLSLDIDCMHLKSDPYQINLDTANQIQNGTHPFTNSSISHCLVAWTLFWAKATPVFLVHGQQSLTSTQFGPLSTHFVHIMSPPILLPLHCPRWAQDSGQDESSAQTRREEPRWLLTRCERSSYLQVIIHFLPLHNHWNECRLPCAPSCLQVTFHFVN